VIIILGANDSKPFNWEPAGKPKNDQQYLADYRTLVDHFLGLSTKPVVYVAYPPRDRHQSLLQHPWRRDSRPRATADQAGSRWRKHVPIIDLNTATLNHPELLR